MTDDERVLSEPDRIVGQRTSTPDGDRARVAQKLASGCRSVARSGPLAAHALEQATIHLRIARKAHQLDVGELQRIVEAFDEFGAELERARWSASGDPPHRDPPPHMIMGGDAPPEISANHHDHELTRQPRNAGHARLLADQG